MENLTITAISRSESNIFTELTKLIAKNDCSIHFSHFYSIGLDSTLVLNVTGNWSGIAKIEAALPALAKKLNSEILFKRSHLEKINQQYLPYRIEIIALDQPGIVYEICEFFDTQEVHVQNWESEVNMRHNTPIFKLKILVYIPTDNNIADLREQFLIFCDELNLDGIMEPEK